MTISFENAHVKENKSNNVYNLYWFEKWNISNIYGIHIYSNITGKNMA